MRIKNLIAYAALALGVIATPFAGRADVSGGDIYSVDLSTEYGGVIPNPGTTLTIGERVTVKIRLINKMDAEGNPTEWRFVENGSWTGSTDPTKAYFAPALGLMLGGQQVYAEYLGSKQVAVGTPPANNFTDLYFQYMVKSGDLALPARFMSLSGKAVSDEDDATDYAIQYCNYLGTYWKLSNNNGNDCVFHFCDANPSPDPDPSYEAGVPQRFITGTGLGINIKTVDFDTNYFEPPAAIGEDGVWRQIYRSSDRALPAVPTIKVYGSNETDNATMYIWVENDDPENPVAQVRAADNPELIDGRWVIKVPIAKGAASANFYLQGMANGEAKVRMSASRELSYTKGGDLIEDWVERTVRVVDPPEPFVMVETLNPAGDPQTEFTCSTDYKTFVGMFRITLSQTSDSQVTVTLDPSEDIIPEAVADRRIGLSLSSEKSDMPWLDRDLAVTFEPGETVKTLYIYALDRTSDYGGKIEFKPILSGAGAGAYTGAPTSGFIFINGIAPVVTSPKAGDELDPAMLGVTYTLDVAVDDSYRNLREEGAWKVRIRSNALGDTKWHDFEDFTVDLDFGNTISVDVDFEQLGENQVLELKVVDPDGVSSDSVKTTISVSEGKVANATPDRGADEYPESGELVAKVYFSLTSPNGKNVYAFLNPLNDDARNRVSSPQLAATGNNGVLITAGKTDSETRCATVTLLDGDASALFEVVLCSQQAYSSSKKVTSYTPGQCTINLTNVVPSITAVYMGGQTIKVNGGVTKSVAQNVEKAFRLAVNEPGQLDLEATGDDAFLTQWKFGTGDWEDVTGNPNLSTTLIKHTFTSPGDQEITVRCQDKDMRKLGKWSEEFTFTVPVLDIPKVVITPVQARKQYYEDETGSDYAFDITLTAPPDIASGAQRLNVEIRKELLGDASKYSVDDLVLSKDAVTFAGGTSSGQSFFLKQLDGTAESSASGFRIVAHVTNPGIDTEGKTWDDGEIEVYIINRKPEILTPEESLDAEGKPIVTTTTIGTDNTLAWSLKDVVADRTGMTVTWRTSEGEEKVYRQGTGEGELEDVMSGKHTFKFNSAGEKSITITALDKDGASASRTLYYTIEASKTLEIVPHGPPTGNGTALSARYQDKASGLGAGRVWGKNLTSIEDWIFGFNCGLDSTWRVYAAGYRNGETDHRENPNFDYTYADPDGKDSFLYAWLQIVQEKDAAKATDTYLAVVPEHTDVESSGTLVNLPSEKSEDSGFAKTILEAVFSKEFLTSDNMGDINQDGIPDIYVKKYDFGVFDDNGDVTGDDLAKLSGFNDDEDFLPSTETSAYGAIIPQLPEKWTTLGTPFTAKTEIRGYHEGLNDAAAQAGITGVKPERIYEVDDGTGTMVYSETNCTISKLEYLAWKKSGLPADQWSPERPTDPALADTDDDGFDDGYEYYFWYRAHVGYLENEGTPNERHRYLTGRRYVPTKPGEPETITSEEIAALMDPLVSSGDASGAETRDSDNDGLPDLLEFDLGTNPFDFDTDGDGLPDGYEVMLGEENGFNPLLWSTAKNAKSDADLNADGDAMAEFFDKEMTTVGVVAKDGSVVRYTAKEAFETALGETAAGTGTVIRIINETGTRTNLYLTTSAVTTNVLDGKVILTCDLGKEDAWSAREKDGKTVRGAPVRLIRGTEITDTAEEQEFFDEIVTAVPDLYWSTWVYGVGGGLALGKENLHHDGLKPDETILSNRVAEAVKDKQTIRFVHYHVYQQLGFDPRTGWKRPPDSTQCINTRFFTALDEFLLMAFFHQDGVVDASEFIPTLTNPLTDIWPLYCTDPLKADTDDDGMPDGWEAYVFAGPKVFVSDKESPKYKDRAYEYGPRTWYSPLMPFGEIANANDRDNDKDKLEWPNEFSGSASSAEYAEICPTIVNLKPEWRNKRWPTDPWNQDTDGDGLKDGEEGDYFIYGDPAATGKAGGGLDPLSWDTDADFLPDPWEVEFAGTAKTTPGSTTATVGANGETNITTTAARADWNMDGMDGTVDDARLDYDNDGLCNWQEYMTGAVRAWRYDDTVSPWDNLVTPTAMGMLITPDPSDAEAWGKFWGDRLLNPLSPDFNPHLVNGRFDGVQAYFSTPTNVFEQAKVKGFVYMFKDGIYHDLQFPTDPRYKVGDTQYNRFTYKPGMGMPQYAIFRKDTKPIYPTKYICCDPRNIDSDYDGMDDYYEMFHGLNPLLGERGRDKVSPIPPLDIIYWSYGGDKELPWSAGNNYWIDTLKPRVKMEGNIADFEVFPWLAGEAKADPDGDGIRNQLEAIMPNVQAASTHLHTDPTPLWMTDTDYALSIPRRYYLPGVTAVMMGFPGNGNSFVYEGVEHKFTEFPWFTYDKDTDLVAIEYDFNEDHFGVAGYHFSFEENEGYDSDHDFLADFEESQGKTKQASDPQDHDDPLRRQAMWFNGTDAFLQTPLPAAETVAVPAAGGEPRENFLFYTVECWAKADAASLAADNVTRVLVERAIVVGESNAGDEQYLRKNFQLGVRNGLWYTKYDAASTGLKDFEEITDGPAATTDWTHLAATYDGHELRLYVNGICSNAKRTEVQPEHGSLAIRVNEAGEITPGQLDYTTISILVGAGARTTQGVTFDALYRGLSMVPTTIADYTGFFKGYVDEVSLWDGARPASDIRNDYEKRVRLTRDLALENRQVVYANWLNGARRTPVSETQLPPQLMYHWAFDHVAGAIRPEDVMRVPAGFDSAWNVIDAKAIWSRPEGWYSRWRRDGIHESIKSTVFTDDSWIPWINDTVAHLPRLDMTTLDSVYWSEDFAGAVPADAFGYQKFAFARRAEVYSKWTQQTYDADHQAYSLTQRTRWDVANSETNGTGLAEAYRFTLRDNDRTGFDFLPFGGAYPRRISESEGGMWDDQGAADAWAENGKDSDNNALPDWWEEYARNNYCQDLDPELPLEWDTPVNYYGVTLRAWQAYLRDLAKGMIRDGNRVVINPDYADTRDVDKDGLPDWWEELYDVQGYSADDADADPDNDGLSNYAEYLLGEVYPFDETIGPQLNLESLRLLNPKLSHSITNQLVTDYFLRYATEFKDVKNAAGKSAFYLNEYFGEIVTDHDFMEDWWENAYASSYVSSKVYDPLDDKDEDGWSNWAECRATLWGGHFDASLIDRWTGSDSSQHVACYPEPIVGVRATYNGKQEVSGSALVIRMTTGQTPRMDATFVIPSTLDSQTRYIGPFSADFALHGHMSPGHINGNSIAFERAKVSSDKTYNWNWAWYDENDETHPLQTSGTFTEYRNFYYRYPHIELEGGDLTWEPFTESYERGGSSADIYGTGVKLGTANLTTGEYELDMSKFEGEVSDYVFRVTYTSRIGYEWPQTVYVSDTKELATGAGAGIAGQGRVREGRNTIEAFFDLNGNGTFDEGEPFGTARNVQVGWHKVPEVVIELKDESPIMESIALAAAGSTVPSPSSATGADTAAAEGRGEDAAGTVLTKTVRVVRESINGQSEFDGIRLKERTLVTKEIVLDDHPYITEADVATSAKPDLDWTWLLKDAAKVGLLASDIKFAGYRVDEVIRLDDGTTTNIEITTFSKDFPGARPAATAVEPIDSAPVYSASPTLRFSISDTAATGYRLQIRKRGKTELVYDSGVTILPGRTGSTVGAPVCAVTPPVYAGAPVYAGITTNRAVFADSEAYQWRVALYDAKYNTTADDTDASAEWSKWASFEMDVQNENRYPKLPTGYGNATVTVRYYGPNTNDLTGAVVVEAFESADFRGQPLAQLRLADLAELASIADITTPNAVLRGLKPGRVFFRAYIDQNDNGSRDKWESWGYANMVGQGFHAIYNPDPMDITVSTADWVVGKKADRVIYIEDCDVNKNEIPDCLEPELFPATGGDETDEEVTDPTLDTDGDGMPDVWEDWNDGFTDPTIPDADAAEPGDVMACIDETRYLITFEDGTKLLLAHGETYKEAPNQLANAYTYDSWYRYGGDDSEIYGVGTNVTITSATLKIAKAEQVTARLVHAQVYARKGYDMRTANKVAYAAGTSVDTKPFGALDKLMVLRYLQAIGATPENPNPEKYKDFEEYVRLNGSAAWSQWTLMPGEVDYNCDKIADGWNLYVMYGLREPFAAAGGLGPVTPWGAIGATRAVSPGGEGLKWSEEYDSCHYPTDPWNPATIGDRYMINGVEYVISDKDAYAYHLKHFPGEEGDKYGDFDNDGLTNYDEFDIMKNNNRTLDADKMFSYFGTVTIPSLTGQCVPDYFLKSTKRNPKITDAAVFDYLGFDYTGHDFIESWWKDQYDSKYVDRTRFEPYDDPDGDGWDNWSEARAKTDPSKVTQPAIEGYTIDEYPIPVVALTLSSEEFGSGSNAAIVVEARLGSSSEGAPDATWSIGDTVAGNKEKFFGFNPGIERHYNLGGSIVPGTFKLEFKDQTADHEKYVVNTNDSKKTLLTKLKVSDEENVWADAIVDTKIDNNSSRGYLVDRHDGDTVYGEIDYDTGDLTIRFDWINEDNGADGCWRTWFENDTECVVTYYWKSYVRASWETKAAERSISNIMSVNLSDAKSGRLRQGPNTFVAFADANGNGEYDPGEPFGCAKDVQVGFDKVVDLSINLTTSSPVLPRFKPYDYAATAASNELKKAESDTEFVVRSEKPVITDLPDEAYVTIVRRLVNDKEMPRRIVLQKIIDADSVITEADVLQKGCYDLEWDTLADDAERLAAQGFPAIDEITKISYAVYVGSGDQLEEELVGWIEKKFATKRAKATLVAPYAAHAESIVSETRPTFRWTLARDGYSAFTFQMLRDGTPVYETVIPAPAKNAAGEYAFQPDLWFGEIDDTAAHLFTNGAYSWRVAPMNAKFGAPADDEWSDEATFTVELADGKVHDTDKGILEAVVRYYGVAAVDEEHPIVVQAFRTADFTGVPAGQTVITNAELLASYDNITNVNARFLGLPAGDYYVRAFVDTTNDFVRSAWESWGYRNNVGSDKTDLYTPVATAVGRNVTGTALVFMEDMDCDLSKVPDCIEGFAVEVAFGVDTDGDGMPDWWEEKYGFDPLDPSDAAEDEDGDGLVNLDEYKVGTDPIWWDTDGDFIPDGVEVNVIGSDPFLQDAPVAAKYDVMAKAMIGDVQIYAVTNANGKVVARYAVRPGDNDLAESAEVNRVYTTFTVPYDDNLYIGAPTNFDRRAAAYMTVATNAVAIHGAVYDWYGFDPSTAVAVVGSNTVAFTAWDKYVTAAYYLPEFGVDDCTALKVGVIDGNANQLPDGWELYVGFATDTTDENPNLASPAFPLTGEAYTTALVEFDRAHDVADPWNRFYIFEQIHGSAKEAYKQNLRPYTNLEARHYLLVDGDTAIDTDGDGLSNYQEFLAKQDLDLWLCVTNVFTDGATPDYFRATAAKSVYAGEQYNGAEWIEAEGRDALGMIEDGLKRAGTRNYDNSGWDYWSVVRNGFDSEYAGINDTDLTFVLRYIDAVMPGECSAKTLPELREFVHTQWAGVKRTAWNYTWNYNYSYSYTYDPETGTYRYEEGDDDDDDTDTRMELEGDKLVTLDEMISFFGGREKMQTTIDSNKQALALDEITLPEPKVDLIVRYTGDKKYVLLVDAYQWNPTHPAAGVQRTAFWNTSAEFNAGVAKVPLATPNAGTLKQGAALFIAYIDQNGNGKFDSADTFGTARMEIGFAGGELAIALGDYNPALPYVDLNASAAGSNAVASAQCGLWVVRTGVNGVKFTGNAAKYAKAVYYRTLYNNVERGLVYPTEWIGKDFIGVDRYFADAEGIAKELGDVHVDSVDYAILVGHGPFTNWTEAVVHEFTVNYDVKRSMPLNMGFTDANEEALALSFDVPTDHPYTKYWMKVVDTVSGITNYYGGTRGYLLPNVAGGRVTVDPLKDCGAILSEGEYEFSFALGNDKFGAPVEEDFGKPLALSVNAKRATDAKFLVTVKHPTADLTGGRMTVAAYESEDLANPVAVVTNADCAEAIELVGLRSGKKYYIAAWYVADAEDGRPSAAVRAPYDTWGYICAFDQSEACFTPLAIEATKDGTPVMVWLQDTDWNDNGRLDREESMTTGITYPYVTGMSPYDPSGIPPFPPVTPFEPPVPVPPGPPVPPTPPIPPFPPIVPPEEDDDWRWAYGDVMAYADIPDVLLVKIGTSAEDAAWYAVMDLQNEGMKLRDEDIPLQTPASEIASLMTTWNMSPDEVRYLDPTVDEETLVGVGRAVTFTGTDAKVLDKRYATVRLVHAQVYAKYGYETGCAAVCLNAGNDPRLVDGIAAAEHPHTKAFTWWDKFLVVRYLEAIGVEGVEEADPTNPTWSLFLYDYYTEWYKNRNRRDSDRDDIGDGWELYTMFGPGTEVKISPFNTADGMLVAPGEGSQLKLVEEFDGGYYPTDPWSIDTDDDSVIDWYAYQYHLKGDDAGKDFDIARNDDGSIRWDETTKDGLSNYAEYLISEVFGYAKLDPEKKFTSEGVDDYFRKVGDLYLGEIFTDHDQVDDTWEGAYAAVANRYVYDPDRDDDKDGWSNCAEFRAGTDPSTGAEVGLVDNEGKEYSRAEFPVPVIEATVVYNGHGEKPKNVVFKAWSEKDAADMLSVPDAVWTRTTDATAAAGAHEKYVGLKPSGAQRYLLDGGTVLGSTVKIEVLNKNYMNASVPSTNKLENGEWDYWRYVGDPDQAKWYLAAKDDGQGNIITIDTRGPQTIGTLDAATGLITIDFARLSGTVFGDRTTGMAYATEQTTTQGNGGYDKFTFEGSHVKIEWTAKEAKLSADGMYYLAEADGENATEAEEGSGFGGQQQEGGTETASKGRGRVKEGPNVFVCFSDENGDGKYDIGEPYGFVRGVDVGWQGAKFTVELTEASPVFARVDLYNGGGETDRTHYWGADSGDIDALTYTNLPNEADADYGLAQNEYEHVRIVPYLVGGIKTDTAYYDREYAVCYQYVTNRVVAEFDINRTTKPCITEADFIRDGKFDIDWDGFFKELWSNQDIKAAVGDVTAVKYRIVFGKSGPVGRESNLADETTKVRAFSTLIERRYEPWLKQTLPTQLKTDGIVHGAQPTFKWRLDENTDILGYSPSSSLFGCSYTAFQIEVYNNDTNEKVYDSGVLRAPAKNAKGEFEWTAPLYAGDQTDLKAIFAKAGNWKWRVAMYNAKFRPEDGEWSAYAEFSTSVDTQQEIDDHNYSAVDVAVKYAGPIEVLKDCADLAKTEGKVRIQAFTSADFSGEPVAQGFVTDKASISNTVDVTANGRLIGLPEGTYYIRAYIDSNGNFVKDDFESWGGAKDPVVVPDASRLAGAVTPVPAVWIEDADIDQDWLPDAWEYAKYGNLATEGAKIDPEGRIVLKKTVYDGLLAATTKANFSQNRSGASLTFFQNIGNATLLLGLENPDVTLAGIADIRAAVEKKIEDGSVKITSLVVDATNGKVFLTVDAKATDSIAGYLLSPVYEIPTSTTVTINVYCKANLATGEWPKTPVKSVDVTITSSMSERIEVPIDGVDFNSGFYKVEIVEK